MNTFLKMVVAALVLSATTAIAAPPVTPEQKAVKDAEVRLSEARKAEALEKERKRAEARADWNSKSLAEAWAIRGQSALDSAQWAGGRALQYTAKADAAVGYYGVVVPSAYVASTAASVASSAQSYADGAFDNTPKQVAVKVEPKK